ncbi:MAG: DUF4062 domain-containing protein, partial [Planctomycetes bacterium]|nr:DUF4062 domain-containing protein [Planctomycetota bacterium]
MSATWRTVRVFISSTFRDMHAERDYLVKVTFPRLRQWCEERRLHLVDIDLRWGVTKEEADNGKAIDICLEEIDGSRPFFVCVLGVRYGWVPDELPPEEAYRFHGMQGETHLSITHLEIVHATQEPVPTLDGKVQPPSRHAFFYFRRPESLPAPTSLSALTPDQRREYETTFFEQLPDQDRVLNELKDDIRQRYKHDDRIFEYSGEWDPRAENPEDTALVGRLTGLDEFGLRVEADLKRGIREQFAEHISQLADKPDPLDEERSHHEAFIENRTQVCVPRSDVENQLTDYVTGDDPRPLVLSGPPGSGKSAILAHWVASNFDPDTRIARWDDATFVVPRFIGASPASTNLARLLGSVSRELVRQFELTEEVAEETPDGQKTTRTLPIEVPADPTKVLANWPRILEAAGKKRRLVVVLDAVNQLDRSAAPLRAYWLPHKLAAGVRIITSVLDHGEKSRPNRKPNEGSEPDWLATLRRRKLPEVPVPALTDDGRRRIIRELPSVFCKTLADDQVTLLLENEATRNPLFLTVALEELRVFGSFEQIPRAITSLPRLRPKGQPGGIWAKLKQWSGVWSKRQISVANIETALEQLFGRVLDRLDRETRRQTPGLVPTLFRMLASAREGVSEQELDDVLARQLPDLAENDRKSAMWVVLRQVRVYLMRKSTARGVLIDFYHRSFWKAVRAKYMPDRASRRQSHHDLADYFAEQPYYLQQPDLADPGATIRMPHDRKVVELPWL